MSEPTNPASAFIDEKRAEIRARMEELRPLVEEHRLLTAADAALSTGVPPAPSVAKPSTGRRGPGRPKKTTQS